MLLALGSCFNITINSFIKSKNTSLIPNLSSPIKIHAFTSGSWENASKNLLILV